VKIHKNLQPSRPFKASRIFRLRRDPKDRVQSEVNWFPFNSSIRESRPPQTESRIKCTGNSLVVALEISYSKGIDSSNVVITKLGRIEYWDKHASAFPARYQDSEGLYKSVYLLDHSMISESHCHRPPRPCSSELSSPQPDCGSSP
jgi:hypothetical protein